MSTRPRIRTVKPEMRHDERYGRLSRDARELFNGLITMADDEGRLRALPSAVLGHVFPYDEDAPRKLPGWLREITSSGMVLAYEHDGLPYLAFRHWRRHQQINKPTPSTLPPPPDPVVVADNSVPRKGDDRDRSGSPPVVEQEDSCSPAQARVRSGPIPSVPDQDVDGEQGAARAIASVNDERLTQTVEVLRQCSRLYLDAELLGVANVLAMYPDADHVAAARLAVSRAVDPAYRTTNAARALEFAFADLAKRGASTNALGRRGRRESASDLLRALDGGEAA